LAQAILAQGSLKDWCFPDTPSHIPREDRTRTLSDPKMMFKIAVIASLVGTALAGSHVSANGQPGCACLGTLPSDIPRVSCDKPWNVNGECVTALVQEKQWLYPANYGTTCQIHIEPGHTGCYYVDTETERPAVDANNAEAMATWCVDPWCYVNPCNCNSAEQYESDYFGSLFYSYAVCGSADSYTGSADGSANKAAKCPDPDGSGAESIKPLVGALGAMAVVASMW
jgi:hypothetical protein